MKEQQLQSSSYDHKTLKERVAENKKYRLPFETAFNDSEVLARELNHKALPHRSGSKLFKAMHRLLNWNGHPLREALVGIALEAAELADQWRDFKVGAAAICYRMEKGVPRFSVLFDANTKPTKDSKKYCAERYLLDQIAERKQEGLKVLALCVVGESQRDDDSNVDHPTLTPCLECRLRLTEVAGTGLVDADTPIVTAHSRNIKVTKTLTVGQALALHAGSATESAGEIGDID